VPIIETLSLGDLLQGWEDDYRDLVTVSLEHSMRAEDDIDAVLNKLLAGHATAVVIKQGDLLLGISVLDQMECKDGLWLNVWTLTGAGMDVWLDEYVEYITRWARLMGLKGVMCGGRGGWEKRLKRYGWKKTAVIMQRELTT